MATFTAHYNLRRPSGGDFVNVASDINANMDIIDTAMFDIRTDFQNADITNLNALDARLDTLEAKEQFKYKTADTIRNATATMADDPDLQVNLPAGPVVLFELVIFVSSSTAADVKYDISYTGTFAVNGLVWGAVNVADITTGSMIASLGQFNVVGQGTAVPQTAGQGSTPSIFVIRGMINPTGAGVLKLRWAQNTNTAVNTAVLAGSHMRVSRMT